MNLLKEFRKEQSELFDEDGNLYAGVNISARQCQLMLQAINQLDERERELSKVIVNTRNIFARFEDDRACEYLVNKIEDLGIGN